MKTTRRDFIRVAGSGTMGWLMLPGLADEFLHHNPAFILPRKSPESQGISSKAIRDFIKAIEGSGIQWHSFMLLRHGNVVAEGWWKPFEAGYKHTLYSLSKSFTSTAIGLLVKDGKMSVDDPVISFFTDELPAIVSDNMKKMTVKHLLTMNSGHGEDTMGKMRQAEKKSWTKAYLELPVPFEPGSHFLYNTGNTYMLGAIVNKLTHQTLEQFLSPRLFQPLGIEGYDWEKSPQGLNVAGYGLRIKTEDIARFGQLYLQKGRWDGKEILTEAWINEATSSQTKSNEGNGDWSQGYGYQFWRCKPGFYRGDGAFGQFCMVMPEQDVVLAITSESSDMQKSMQTCWDHLLPAMKEGKLPDDPSELTVLNKELKNLVLPVPIGSVTSGLSSKFHEKRIAFDQNEYGWNEVKFHFIKDHCLVKFKMINDEKSIKFGWQDWHTSKESVYYPFPVAGRINVPSRIAGTATWINENTLQLNARFVEAIHGDKLTCTFSKDGVNISFMHSLAEITKNNPDRRKELVGKLA